MFFLALYLLSCLLKSPIQLLKFVMEQIVLERLALQQFLL